MKNKKNSISENKSNTESQSDPVFNKRGKIPRRKKAALINALLKKQKAQRRIEMLEELKSFELSAPSLSLMTSISQTQTIGLRNVTKGKKKHQTPKPVVENSSSDEMPVDELVVDEKETNNSEHSENEIP